MNFFNKSSALLFAGVLLVAFAIASADNETADQQPEVQVPVEELKAVEPEPEQVQPEEPQQEGTLAKKIINRGKLLKDSIVYNGEDSKNFEVRYKEAKSSLNAADSEQVAQWIANFKSTLINFLTTITANGFNKEEDLDKEISALSESLKTATNSIVESELYKSNRELQQQVKAAFELLHARAPLTRERVSELENEKFSIEDIQIWSDVLEGIYTKVCKPEMVCSLSSVKIDNYPIRNILHWYEDMLTQNGLGKAVDGVKKIAYQILKTL